MSKIIDLLEYKFPTDSPYLAAAKAIGSNQVNPHNFLVMIVALTAKQIFLTSGSPKKSYFYRIEDFNQIQLVENKYLRKGKPAKRVVLEAYAGGELRISLEIAPENLVAFLTEITVSELNSRIKTVIRDELVNRVFDEPAHVMIDDESASSAEDSSPSAPEPEKDLQSPEPLDLTVVSGPKPKKDLPLTSGANAGKKPLKKLGAVLSTPNGVFGEFVSWQGELCAPFQTTKQLANPLNRAASYFEKVRECLPREEFIVYFATQKTHQGAKYFFITNRRILSDVGLEANEILVASELGLNSVTDFSFENGSLAAIDAEGKPLGLGQSSPETVRKIVGHLLNDKQFTETSARPIADLAPIKTEEKNRDFVLEAPKDSNLASYLAELESLIGLADVKKTIRQIVAVQRLSTERQRRGLPAQAPMLNLVFLGEPGTGKTTVARIVANIYGALGLLSQGHLIEVSKKDLVSESAGQTGPKTDEVIAKAIGGVLFIDEAYSLGDDPTGILGSEALSTLVKAMEDNRGDLAIIIAGYTEPMLKMLKTNEGLKSRFARQIIFPSYTTAELLQIFKVEASKQEIGVPKDVETALRRHLEINSTSGSNGNARYVRNLFSRMYENMGLRALDDGVIEEHEISVFMESDVPASLNENTKRLTLSEALSQLDDLVGLEPVKEKIRELVLISQAEAVRAEANRPVVDSPLSLVFTGEPGTGKTTVARIVANIYQALGVLPRGHLVETGRQDLIAGYIGQTASKVKDKIDEALGGVLFIDEAYSLTLNTSGSDYGQEAVATIVQLMENHRGEFAVIVAGYKAEMQNFLDANPGLKSRFDNEIDFPNYSPAELLEIICKISASKSIDVPEDVKSALLSHFARNDTGGSNGNGRYSRKLFEKMYANMASRASEVNFDLEALSQFVVSDIPEKISESPVRNNIGFQAT